MNDVSKEECTCLKLFTVFFRIGMFTIGGGMAMMPLIQAEIVDRYGWMTDEEFVDALAVSQGLPGVIAINMGTYVGNHIKGIKGALAATLGVILPSFLIIIAIVELLHVAGPGKYIDGAMNGMKAAALALILCATWSLGKQVLKTPFQFIVAAVSTILIAVFDVSAVIVIVAGVLSGIIIEYAGGSRICYGSKDKEKEEEE